MSRTLSVIVNFSSLVALKVIPFALPDPVNEPQQTVSEDQGLTPRQIAELNRRNTDNFFGFAAAVANKYNMEGAKEYLKNHGKNNFSCDYFLACIFST